MPTFYYKALTSSGERTNGSLMAENRLLALKSIEKMDVYPLEVSSTPAGAEAPVRLFAPVKSEEITLFSRQLADLLEVGVPITRALDTMIRECRRKAFRQVLESIKDDLSEGKTLEGALRKYPDLFGDLYANMVRAGEEGGFLPEVLDRVATFREKQENLKARVKGAMVYPAVLSVLGVATVGYLLVFFIPRFTRIFTDMKAALPAPTRMLLGLSGFLQGAWPLVALGALAGFVFLRRSLATPRGRELADRALLAAPLIGPIVLATALSRFCRTLGTLLASGVPILHSLEIARGAAGNQVLAAEIEEAARLVKEGDSLASGLGRAEHFPPVAKEKIAIGEETGSIDAVLARMSESYDAEVDRKVKVFLTLFEPAIIVLMAGVVGFIVISLLLPIFTLNDMVG